MVDSRKSIDRLDVHASDLLPPSPAKVPTPLDYQSKSKVQSASSRMIYGFAAGISWLGASVFLFVALIMFVQGLRVLNQANVATSLYAFLFAVPMLAAAWYFTHMAAR